MSGSDSASLCSLSVPGAPPRKLEVEALNSTAIRVTWKPPLQVKQHGQIRGYQVIFSRLENGEPRGQPNIMDIALPEAQVTAPPAVPPPQSSLHPVGFSISAAAWAELLLYLTHLNPPAVC